MAKQAVAHRRHFDVANPPSYNGSNFVPKGGKRSGLPPEVIHKIMMKSHDGGRGRCEDCKDHFSMGYMTLMQRIALTEPVLICGQCKREHPDYRKVDKVI